MERTCPACGAILVPHQGEKPWKYRARRTCSRACGALLAARCAAETMHERARRRADALPRPDDGSRLLPLAGGGTTRVDADVFAWAARFVWRQRQPRPKYPHHKGYVEGGGGRGTRLLHRQIMAAPAGMEVDHINGDVLDNRRENLRLATRSQNEQNRRGAQSLSITGVRGVLVERRLLAMGRRRPYRARIWIAGKGISLGTYATVEEAAAAARAGRQRYMTHSTECAKPLGEVM